MRDRQRASPRSSHTASPRTLRKCKPRNGSSFAVRQPAPRVFFAKSLPSPVENLPGPGGWTDQKLPDGTIVWTSPTRAGLSHQPRRLRPVPTATARMSGAHTAQAQPLPRQSQADCPRPQQASRSTPGQRRNPACQPRTQQEIADRKRRNHMRKMLILFKGGEPSTSPWCAWVNGPCESEQLPPDWKPPPFAPQTLDDEPPF